MIVSPAMTGDVEVLVTGDQDLLEGDCRSPYLHRHAAGSKALLKQSGASFSQSVFSPDGHWLAYLKGTQKSYPAVWHSGV